MDLLAYWRWDVYRRDLDEGAGFHFNSRQPRLHSALGIGDRLWLVTGKPTEGGTIYLVNACLQIIAKTENPPDYKYGKYRVWADVSTSAFFAADGPDASPILRQLQFSTQQPILAGNIGQAIQTMRGLSSQDSALLVEWSASLRLEPRAYRVVDEAILERAFRTNEDAVRETVAEYHTGASARKRAALVSAFRRNRSLVEELHEVYRSRCQLCGYDPVILYGVHACNAHHIVYLSRGGKDTITNMILICPNHHEVIHASKAVFDYKDLHYIYENGRREPLVLNKHLVSS